MRSDTPGSPSPWLAHPGRGAREGPTKRLWHPSGVRASLLMSSGGVADAQLPANFWHPSGMQVGRRGHQSIPLKTSRNRLHRVVAGIDPGEMDHGSKMRVVVPSRDVLGDMVSRRSAVLAVKRTKS